MVQLKRWLTAITCVAMLITAVARLNALNAGGTSPHGTVHAFFDLNAPVTGPFPSDWFPIAETSHKTERRVSLPMPDCETRRSDCEDIAVLYQFAKGDQAAPYPNTTAILRVGDLSDGTLD